MASRFVSAGAIDPETGEAAPVAAPPASSSGEVTDSKTDEWLVVQRELDAERRRREERRVAASTAGEEKSLFEVLEANKAAKQAAFEEANRIKNQFRALDDDEIDFLDDVAARRRAEEDRVRKETEEGLRAFRAAQSGGDGGAAGDDDGFEDEWAAGGAAGRKRKRDGKGRERLGRSGLRGVVRRKTSEGEEAKGVEKEVAREGRTSESADPQRKASAEAGLKGTAEASVASPPPAPAPGKPKLGLVDYGSDDEDEDD